MLVKRSLVTMCALVVVSWCFAGCETAPRTATEREQLEDEARVAIRAFTEADPTMRELFDNSHGYAVFPDVGRGGFIVGGAHGHGVVYERGRVIGYSELTQGDIGPQLGGQTYRQVIFFENESALNRFRQERLEFAAHASAVAATEGASADANYTEGVLVMTQTTGGLMFEAAIGGQNFTFEPVGQARRR